MTIHYDEQTSSWSFTVGTHEHGGYTTREAAQEAAYDAERGMAPLSACCEDDDADEDTDDRARPWVTITQHDGWVNYQPGLVSITHDLGGFPEVRGNPFRLHLDGVDVDLDLTIELLSRLMFEFGALFNNNPLRAAMGEPSLQEWLEANRTV